MRAFWKEFLKINLVAVLIGSFVSLFLFVLNRAVYLNELFIEKNSILLYALILVGCVFGAYFILKRDKNSLGSGIPILEDYILGNRKIEPFETMIHMFIVCAMTFFGGLGLGSEGPSVYFGGLIAIAVNRIFKEEERKDLVSIGGACGFGCAFLSPICAFFYAFEELNLKINFLNILKCLYICGLGFLMTFLIFGHKFVYFDLEEMIEWKYLGLFVFLGIVVSLSAYLFVFAVIKIKDRMSNLKMKRALLLKIALAFSFSFLTMVFLHKLAGSGAMGVLLLKDNLLLEVSIFLVVFRILFSSFSASTGVSGGLVIPMLVIGAGIGNLIFIISSDIFQVSEEFNALFIVCGMVCLFGCATKTPITTFFLSFTFIDYKVVLLPILITVCFSSMVSKILKQEDIYHLLRKRLS